MVQIMNYEYLAMGAAGACVLLAGGLAWLFMRVRHMDRVRREFFIGAGENDGRKTIDDAVVEHNQGIARLTGELDDLGKYVAGLAQANKKNFQKVGFVRFDQFGDASGAISFTVALLDANDDGVIISSLHGREGNRVYAKQVTGGVSKSQLTQEEVTAIRQAGEGR